MYVHFRYVSLKPSQLSNQLSKSPPTSPQTTSDSIGRHEYAARACSVSLKNANFVGREAQAADIGRMFQPDT